MRLSATEVLKRHADGQWQPMDLGARFDAKWLPEPNTGCWLWTAAVDAQGYGLISVDRRSRLAHRVSWQLRHGPIPSGLCALHRCDTPCCVNPDHLFLGTRADNAADCIAKGRKPRGPASALLTRGADNGRARLVEADVLRIRHAVAQGATQSGLAAELGVGRSTIHDIVSRRRWAHVEEEALCG